MTESKMEIEAPKKNTTPSASAESASPHPCSTLAQNIHRLTLLHSHKLSTSDAAPILGVSPEELLSKVQSQVLFGELSMEEAIAKNTKRIESLKKGEIKSIDDKEGPLLNPTLYNHLASILSFEPLSSSDTETVTKHHEEMLDILQELVTKASEEMGDMEVLAAKLTIARYSTASLSKSAALAAYEEVLALPKLSTGKKLDALLEMSRVASFWEDTPALAKALNLASSIVEKGGDWDRRNRLKAYTALYSISKRDLKTACDLAVEGIATFSCGELCDYEEFCMYAVIFGVMYLVRVELKKRVVDGSEILTVAKEIPLVIQLANTLYECNYKSFLSTLVSLHPHLLLNRHLAPHTGYILRELHILAYRQFLDSYQSVTLSSMATSFGVSTSYLEEQLSKFIAGGRLNAKIDSVGGIVETMKTDWKNARYREMIREGDLLLNRVQKLGRVVDL